MYQKVYYKTSYFNKILYNICISLKVCINDIIIEPNSIALDLYQLPFRKNSLFSMRDKTCSYYACMQAAHLSLRISTPAERF